MTGPRWRNTSRWYLAALLPLLVAVGGTMAWQWWRARSFHRAVASHGSPRAASHDARPANAAATVAYVGDNACQPCHEAEFSDYRQHPMANSLAPVAFARRIETFHEAPGISVSSRQYRYRAGLAGDQLVHIETLVGEFGENLVSHQEEIEFSIGSGAQGRSYLVRHEGYLFLSPITWYTKTGRWDLSPGYERNNQHFQRPIIPECLFCHANHAKVDELARNHYLDDIFVGYGIGCERCHGPGQLHVARESAGAHAELHSAGDRAIVNPARLAPKLREAVCEQCHLSGTLRLLRRGQQTFSFRPGLPLEQFWSVFVKSDQQDDSDAFVGHVEQMYASRCYQQSDGRLGCTSCHDPHRKPAPEHTVDFYRGRCLKCHGPVDCNATQASRQATLPVDNCMACHMPRRKTEVQHTATTDHTVLRSENARTVRRPVSPDIDQTASLTHFHRREWRREVRLPMRETDRDLGIALLMALDVAPQTVSPADMQLAASLLQIAVAEHPDDASAAEAYALSQHLQGNSANALALLADLARRNPERETASERAALMAQSLDRHDEAISFWKQAVSRNSWNLNSFVRLAISLAQCHRWDACAAASRRALELQPSNPGARQLLVESLLGLKDPEQADREFQLLQKIDPSNSKSRRRWYDSHPLR